MQTKLRLETPRGDEGQDRARRNLPANAAAGSPAAAISAFLVLGFFVFLTLYRLNPPPVTPATAPASEFSAERALPHLEAIANSPRLIGSPEHARARDYILSQLEILHLSAEVQQTTVVNENFGPPMPVARVNNILARLKGEQAGKAVMLVAHYDSVPYSPGAGDDGAGVAAVLETLRALEAGPALEGDVIALLTDGEEEGLLGAKAFVEGHRWTQEVGVVLNFEARGNQGPVLMFETSDDNAWLIERLADTAEHPFATSLVADIYRMLPNDTDMSVFRRAGYAGLNFAFINGSGHYHAEADRIENLDMRSLQHHGSYALALTRSLASASLESLPKGDACYFDLMGLVLVHYSTALIKPLAAFAVLLFVTVIILGVRARRLTIKGLFLGASASSLGMVVVTIITSMVWQVLARIEGDRLSVLRVDGRSSNLVMFGLAALSLSVVSLLCTWRRFRTNNLELTVGGLTWWAVASAVTAIFLPGAAYMFTWSLLLCLLPLAHTVSQKQPPADSLRTALPFLICGALVIVIIVPTFYYVYIGLGLSAAPWLAALLTLLLGSLIPHLKFMTTPSRWLLPALSMSAAIVLIVAGHLVIGFSNNTAKVDSLFYALQADTGTALWASYDQKPDEWTTQVWQSGASRSALPEFFPLSQREFLSGPAPALNMPPPDMTVLSDRMSDGIRSVHVRLRSPRQAAVLSIYTDKTFAILSASIDGKPIASDPTGRAESRLLLRYYALPAEGIELQFTTKSNEPLGIRLVDQSYGLPRELIGPRPESVIRAAAFSFNQDCVMISKYFTLPARP